MISKKHAREIQIRMGLDDVTSQEMDLYLEYLCETRETRKRVAKAYQWFKFDLQIQAFFNDIDEGRVL